MLQDIQEFFAQNKRDLVLLVHPEVKRLDETYVALLSANQWQSFSIGKALSQDMLSGKVSGSSKVQAWLFEQVRGISSNPVLLHGIDLLFEPSFKLNPVAIFEQISRSKPLVVLWPGTYKNQVLSYAVPEHYHYRTWRKPEARIMNL